MIIIDFSLNAFLVKMSLGSVCVVSVSSEAGGEKFIEVPLISVMSLHGLKPKGLFFSFLFLVKVIQCTQVPQEAGHISPAAIRGTLNLSPGASALDHRL